jgi:hypothetical protein
MRIQSLIFSLIIFLFPLVAFSGSGHDHGHARISKSQAEMVATTVIESFVEKKKIDSSWKSIKASTSEKKKFPNGLEWVVSFKNENISDSAKQTIYVFLTLDGGYLATNYTGK